MHKLLPAGLALALAIPIGAVAEPAAQRSQSVLLGMPVDPTCSSVSRRATQPSPNPLMGDI